MPPLREYVGTASKLSLRMNMKNLTAISMAALLTIAVHGAAYAADSGDSAYVMQQNQAAPVTVTESPDHPTEQSTGEIKNPPEEGSESHSSGTASEAASTEDQRQTAEQYAARRQKIIEHCELNYGIDCVREVDIELGAEALYRDHVVHLMPRMGGMR